MSASVNEKSGPEEAPSTARPLRQQTGFAPVSDGSAAVLILGSFPGRMSLETQQYYGHPRNAFWPIMARLLGFDGDIAYHLRLAQLRKNRIALWDVLAGCIRAGSLDTSIEPGSAVVNDFLRFFSTHPGLELVVFNGARAELEFGRKVLPHLPAETRKLTRRRLPSTSPAMATLSLEQKVEQWRVITEVLKKTRFI
jgi:TDG/mug DNA glycosylase family protein